MKKERKTMSLVTEEGFKPLETSFEGKLVGGFGEMRAVNNCPCTYTEGTITGAINDCYCTILTSTVAASPTPTEPEACGSECSCGCDCGTDCNFCIMP